MAYQPGPNCIYFYNERCSHPSAQRMLLPNKPCVLGELGDGRCQECSWRIAKVSETPPPFSSSVRKDPIQEKLVEIGDLIERQIEVGRSKVEADKSKEGTNE